jgi:hypothetical protein
VAGGDGNRGSFGGTVAEEMLSHKVTNNGEGVHRNMVGMAQSTLLVTPSSESFNRGRFFTLFLSHPPNSSLLSKMNYCDLASAGIAGSM